jgi:hypothetical protein
MKYKVGYLKDMIRTHEDIGEIAKKLGVKLFILKKIQI